MLRSVNNRLRSCLGVAGPLVLAVAVTIVAPALDRAVAPSVIAHLDIPPPGVDVTHQPSIQELQSASPPGNPGLPGLSEHVEASCSGTGTDGNRVQVIYAVEQGKTDRYDQLLAMLRSWVADVDDTFALSSRKTGGGLRVRWVHQNCVPVIAREVLPAGALKNGFTATINALKARGYGSKARKYLVFADDATLCGVGQMYGDSGKDRNHNDGAVPMFARVDSACWTFPENWHSTAAHEIMHTLGGVQDDAPHGSDGGHCRDEDDAMCYDDDGSGPVTMTQTCPTGAGDEGLFDCRNDDYFSISPVASSYLATHWNPARSSFLDGAAELPDPPPVTISGPSSVRPGLAATLTASSSASLSYRWSATPATCLPDRKTAATVKLMCPANYTGSVQVTVSGAASSGVAGMAARTATLAGGPAASITPRLKVAASRVYHGKPARLTGTLRYGNAPVRGRLYLYSAPAGGGSFTRISGPDDTGSDGAHTWTVRPKRGTRYAMSVETASGTGWSSPPPGSTAVKVNPHPTKWTVSVKKRVVHGKLLRTDGTALAKQKVVLQYRAGSSTWRNLGSRTTGRSGSVSYKVSKRGTGYRWVYKGGAANARSTSATVSVR